MGILLIPLLFIACKREKLASVKQELKCTTGVLSILKVKQEMSDLDLQYNQFGDFITALTQERFIGELGVVRFHAENNDFSSKMTLIMREANMGKEPVFRKG